MCKLSVFILSASGIGIVFLTVVLVYNVSEDFSYTKDSWETTCSFGRDDRIWIIGNPLQIQGISDLSVDEDECKDYAAEKWANDLISGNKFLGDSAQGYKSCDYKFKSAIKITPAFTTNDLGCKKPPDTRYCMDICKENLFVYSSYHVDQSTEGFLSCRCANSLVPGTNNGFIATGIFKVDDIRRGIKGNLDLTFEECYTYAKNYSSYTNTKYFHVNNDMTKPLSNEQNLPNLPTGCISYYNSAWYMLYNNNVNNILCGSQTDNGVQSFCYQKWSDGDTKGCYVIPEHTKDNKLIPERVYYSRSGNGCKNERKCVTKKLSVPDTRLVHCGECGKCSTVQDANVYINTSNTLTDKMKECSIVGIAGGSVQECITERIGMTSDCAECFAENIECTKKHCDFICGYETILDLEVANEEGHLSKCIKCDEYHCGKKFKACAGMTRRRAGLMSDIDRSLDEICPYNIRKEMRDKGY